MKSTYQLITMIAVVLACATIAVAQNQNQNQSGQEQQGKNNNGYQREPYTPYVKPPEPRVIDSKSMVQLDGGEVGGAFFRGNQPGGNRQTQGGGRFIAPGSMHQGPQGPTRFMGGNGNLANNNGGNTGDGFQVSFNNGARTISVNEAARKIKIIEDPNTGIYVEITRSYGPRQMAQLKRKMPDLADYIEMFPNEIGSEQVKLSIDITSKFSALTPEDLEDQDKGAFNIYKRYTRQASNNSGAQNTRNQGRPNFPNGPEERNRRRNLPTASFGGGGG